MVFSGIVLVNAAIGVALFDGDRKVAVVVHPRPVAVDVVVALLALAEDIGGLQRRIAASFHVVFDVVVHRGAEDQGGVVTAVGVERRQCAEGADIGTVEIEDRLRVALGVVGGDES